MEVHHHSHTPRKKWTHYFWEFLMLFLAVFCGFMAENIREHMVEKRKAKQYIKSFVEDLRADTATCSRLIGEYKMKQETLGAYSDCYDSIKQNLSCNFCIIALIQASRSFSDFINADRTLQQLKSAGGLRLLAKQDADSISIYDAEIRKHIQGERTSLQEAQTVIRAIDIELIDFDVLNSYIQHPENSGSNRVNAFINIKNKPLVSKYFVALFNYLENINWQIERIKSIRKHAESLIYFFSKKYQLK